jgi:superfamily II DNA/RNA helicase
MALNALVGMLARDWNRIIWKEGCYDPAAVMIGMYVKSKKLCNNVCVNLSAGYDAIISALRLDDLLGSHAVAMGGFHGPLTMTTIPRNDNGGVKNAKLCIMISTDLATHSLDVPNVSHIINFDLPIDGNGGYKNAYMQRGGHACRLGRKGKVMLLVGYDQEFVLERSSNKLLLDLKCVARQEKPEKKNTKQVV